MTPISSIPVGIPDWVNWVSICASIMGLLVSAVGLWATYNQARAAKDAAFDAKAAVNEAVDKLQAKNLLSSLSATVSQILLLKEYVSSDNIIAARALFHVCSRNIKEIFYNLEIDQILDAGDPKSSLDLILKELSTALDVNSMTNSKRASVLRSLRKISEKMSTEEAKRKWAK